MTQLLDLRAKTKNVQPRAKFILGQKVSRLPKSILVEELMRCPCQQSSKFERLEWLSEAVRVLQVGELGTESPGTMAAAVNSHKTS